MAKKATKTSVAASGVAGPVVNIELLKAINAAAIAGGTYYISQADGLPLLQQNLIEVNQGMLDTAGNAAARLTDAGMKMIAPPTETASSFAIITDAVLPKTKRGGGGGAPSKYPFDKLEIGQSFFVAKSDETPDPVKTLGSTVSSANMRFSEDTGQTKQVTRTKRGPGNKAIKNADGTNVKETATVAIRKPTRKFSIRAVKAGEKYGAWVAPADGALIARVALKEGETVAQAEAA